MEGGFTLSKFYRNVAWLFFASTLLLLIFLAYLIWARVSIVVTTVEQAVSQEFVVTVTDGEFTNDSPTTLSGRVRLVEVEATVTFDSSGQKSVSTDVVGEVTITNSYS